MCHVIFVEVKPNWGYHFVPTSFFPAISLDEILEREFQITYALNIPFDYNDKEYYEFVWFYERLVKQRNDDNAEEQSRTSITNLGFNPNMNGKTHGRK